MAVLMMKFSLCILSCMILIISTLSGCALKPAQPEKTMNPEDEIFQKAESFYEGKTYYRALYEYEKLLNKYPKSIHAPESAFRTGEIHMILGNSDAAKAAFEKVVDRYSSSLLAPEAMSRFLAACFKDREFERIIKKSSAFLERDIPKKTRIAILKIRGESFFEIKDYQEAALAYSQITSESPEYEKTEINNRIRKAVSMLDTSKLRNLAETSKNPLLKGWLLFQLAVNLESAGNYREALAVFKSFVEGFPDHEMVAEANQRINDMATRDPYNKSTIGCLLPLSGKFKAFGIQAQRGIELALASFKPAEGDRQVKFVIKDTGSRNEKAAEAARQLADEGVMAILGPVGPSEDAVKAAQSAAVPVIALSSKENITGSMDYVFRNFLTSQMQAEAAVGFAFDRLGAKSFAILHPEDEYGKSMKKYFEDRVIKRGGTIYATSSYPPGLTDFSAFIKRVAARNTAPSDPANSKPYDVLFIPDGIKNAGLILSQLNAQGLGNVQVMGTNLWNSQKLIQSAGQAAEGVIFPDGFTPKSRRPEVQEFVAKFSGAYGGTPGFIEAVAYDSAMMLFGLISQQSITSRTDLKNSLHSLRNFPGIAGMTSFGENGEAYRNIYMIKIENGDFTEFQTDNQ